MRGLENLDKGSFPGAGNYGIPPIEPVRGKAPAQWLSFNYAKRCTAPADKGLHFFVDDYQFVRLWNAPDRYLELLRRFACVCTPDFSLYTDMPPAMQIYNHYRKHWLAAYWQQNGISVIPTISWSTPDSYAWCFDGEPVGGMVAVSSVGCMARDETKQLFLQGYEEMLCRLKPSEVIFYGKVPLECDWNVRRIPPHYERMEKEREKTHGRQGSGQRNQPKRQGVRHGI